MKNPLPENIDAEKALIAFAVTEGLAADRVLEKLAPEQFSLEAHQNEILIGACACASAPV